MIIQACASAPSRPRLRPAHSALPDALAIRVVPPPASLGQSGPNAQNASGPASMTTNSLLKQYSDERAALVQSALPKAVAIILGRRRVLSGIRWSGDLVVTAAEAIDGAAHVDIRLDGDELGAEVIATDLTTDIAILRATHRETEDAST